MAKTVKKRIVICADGTWNDPEDKNPTNVLRMARAVKPISKNDTKQVVFYDWGVGSYYAKVRGGAVGLGIMKNIQDGYRFIVQNYNPGDEIFLFGFSRGAYTVRCLNGLLNNCGILKRTDAKQIQEAFDFYKKRGAKPSSQVAKDWRKAHSYGPDRGSVDFIGVWDTVGALGIPTRVLAFMDQNDLFYDQELGSNVKVARHAVSIDERREDFKPTLWGKKEAIDIKQVWFAGVHRVPQHRSYKSFWRALGKRRREIPVDSVMHVSVKKRLERMDYAPQQLEDWLSARNGDWGNVEGS